MKLVWISGVKGLDRRAASGVMLTVLLVGLLTAALNVPVVEAGGTVYIRADGAWPMFHHDLRHTGCSTSKAPITNRILWSYKTGMCVWSSPAVADGMVFIGSTDHNVYALNETTGTLIWNYTTGDMVESSPAVADGMVFIGSMDRNVYALNETTGAHIWNYTTGGNVESSPAVADGMVFIGSNDHNVYALNETTGTLIWSYTTGWSVESSPAVADGMVFIGSSDRKLYCFGSLFVTNITTTFPWGASAVYPAGDWYVDINVTVENLGHEQTVNVTAYYDSNIIDRQEITLNQYGTSGYKKNVKLTWDVTGVDPCTIVYPEGSTKPGYYIPYNITISVSGIMWQDGNVTVRRIGDANGDGHCTGPDLTILGMAWWTEYGYPYYEWLADFNGDGKVKSADFTWLAMYWYEY